MKDNPHKSKSTAVSKAKTTASKTGQFPIVCIGASAGGLEAMEQFLSHVPENTGMAFIIIQHLDPTQKGMLPELLQRTSHMPVLQVKDRMHVKPDFVYVIPPNTSMSILKGVLHLFEPIEARGLRLPIDFFLRSLADDQQENGIAVILSGMGSDGSAGLRALKGKNGIALVQDPAEAKYDSMPRNAIDAVVVDIIAPASELPVKLVEFIKYVPIVKSNLEEEIKDQSSLEKIIIILRSHTGNDFSLYKKNTLYRRIERRMSVHKIDKIVFYVRLLQENPKEVDILFKELLIGVTNFFRDPAVWDKVKETVFPALIANQQEGGLLRAWVPGCSTGEEAYSLAIIFKEVLEGMNPHKGISLQIFATDLDNEAVETARRGWFPSNIVADVSPKRLSRFFTPSEEGYRIKAHIREMVVFAKHNITLHPPFTRIDILTCRNLLIYMDSELQKKILGLFYYSMNQQGFMVLGSAETLGVQSNCFKPVDNKLKIYQRATTNYTPELFDFPSSFSRTKQTHMEQDVPVKSSQNIQIFADQLLLQQFSPPGVLVNDKGDIIYISGSTGKYLEPAVGKANMNIYAMLREGLRNDFPSAFRLAILKKDKVVLENLKVGTKGKAKLVNITIQCIDKPEALQGMLMIIFNDAPQIHVNKVSESGSKGENDAPNTKQLALEKELLHARGEMQNSLEEMQTSQEELKSTNEELQSTNEELQSTNEELTTSKEEMQSLNEELQTVNAELQSKVDEFSRMSNDMKNLLNSTDIATLFLDKDLNIRRFTNQATKIFKLIKSDIGRPFTDQVSDLIYPELATDAIEVLRTLVFVQKQITTSDGRWFSTRIMPYRTFDDRIDGLVITFFNISDYKKVEVELNETRQMHGLLLNLSTDIIIKLSTQWKIEEFNVGAEKFFGKKMAQALNKNYFQLFIPESFQKKAEKELNKILNEREDATCQLHVITGGGSIEIVDWSVNVLLNDMKMPTGMILITKNTKS